MNEVKISIDHHTFTIYEIVDKHLPTLVCLHGMTGDSKSFIELTGYLLNDFHLILLDLPGHGETEPLGSEEDYLFSSLANRIMGVIMRMTSEPVYVLGHSWGADLSLHIAKQYPHQIKGLILIDGGYVFPEMVQGYKKEKALSDWAEYIDSSRYQSWTDVVNIYQEYTTRPWDPQVDGLISSNFVIVDGQYQLRADRDSLLATIKAFYHEPCSTTYQGIECSVLFFHATIPVSDTAREKAIEKLLRSVRWLKIVGIENTKHNVHWDCPERVAEEIREWMNNSPIKVRTTT
ncbi:alpha/beta fold hydrolase [Rossellomorea vietnamensis]|uniref:alpha/beta fold hydrolase n=1 Tax=Rossellomorea vietnamensis TaxID=218284 RepID=UPI001E3FC6B3|nr:alpha/beta hydrolase [Rossellomorea vietnamensis]MCC5801271.1 alpha/beta hydrolase [Rossellomorea vietnamensis]